MNFMRLKIGEKEDGENGTKLKQYSPILMYILKHFCGFSIYIKF